MPTERAAKQVSAVFFLVAGGFSLVNLLINRSPLEEWGLTILLLVLGAALLVWLWFDSTQAAAPPKAEVKPQAAIVPASPAALISSPPTPIAATQAPPPQPAPATKEPAVPMAKPAPPVAVEAPGPLIADAQASEPAAEAQVAEAMAAPPAQDAPQIVPHTPGDEIDDLTRVEGIGPKYRDVLIAAGIDTFDKLANTSQEGLEEIVKAAGMRRAASMTSWREQAALAAKNDWEGLDKLQTTLSGGRR